MTRRMLMAMISLVGLFIAIYLTLYKLGIIGSLACTNLGSCETVQLSRWATFLGMPVAAWGIGFYLAMLAASVVGTLDSYETSPAISLVLMVMTGVGVLFSAYLTALELWVIHAICFYCVVSAILVTILFVIAVLDWRAVRGAPGATTPA